MLIVAAPRGESVWTVVQPFAGERRGVLGCSQDGGAVQWAHHRASCTAQPGYYGPVTQARTPPLVFVDEYGQANLDVETADVGTHFILTAVLIQPEAAAETRAAVDAVRAKYFQTGELRSKRLASNYERFRRVLEDLRPIPFKFYAVVVDKREIRTESGLAYKDSFYKFLSGLLYRKLFGAFSNLSVTADAFGREDFMEDFARYLLLNHRTTLFDRPTIAFVDSRAEPLVQLADIICGTIARTYDATKTTESGAELLALIRSDHALLIDEWPVRYRPQSADGAIVAGDPNDSDIARYCISKAEDFLQTHGNSSDEEIRAQVLVLKTLLYEVRFGEPRSYVSTQQLQAMLELLGEPRSDQWMRTNVIARLRDANVLIASSPHGYKLPMAVADVVDFVEVVDTNVHPMLNRVAGARDAVLLITQGRVDVLAGERHALLRAAVDAVHASSRKPP